MCSPQSAIHIRFGKELSVLICDGFVMQELLQNCFEGFDKVGRIMSLKNLRGQTIHASGILHAFP